MTKARTYYIVTLRGSGLFPFDMLRYDRATPDREADAASMEQTARSRAEVSVDVRMDTEPTRGRWQSFGWTVTNVYKRTV